jgi:hypothetical protein
MKAAMLAGRASRNNYAYLADRVAANAHKPQVYGTQGRCVGNVWKPNPIAVPEGLDRRRHEMGMWPMDEYLGIVNGMCKPITPHP